MDVRSVRWVIALVVSFTSVVNAAPLPEAWTSMPLPGGETVATVVVKSGRAVATTRAGNVYSTSDGTTWMKIATGMVQADVHAQSGAGASTWAVDARGRIFQLTGDSPTLVSGSLVQVVLGSGRVFGLNSAGSIYQWGGSSGWVHRNGTLTSLSVDDDNNLWGVNRAGNIYRARLDGSSVTPWEMGPRLGATNTWAAPAVNISAARISAVNDRSVWSLDTSGLPWHYNGVTWDAVSSPGPLAWIAARPDGGAWAVTATGQLLAGAPGLRFWTPPASPSAMATGDKVVISWSQVYYLPNQPVCNAASPQLFNRMQYMRLATASDAIRIYGQSAPGMVIGGVYPTAFTVEMTRVGNTTGFYLRGPSGGYVVPAPVLGFVAAGVDPSASPVFLASSFGAGPTSVLRKAGTNAYLWPWSLSCATDDFVVPHLTNHVQGDGRQKIAMVWTPYPSWVQ